MEKVQFTEEKATMLATLYARAVDSASATPILADPTARSTISRIDYDFRSLGVTKDVAIAVALRAKTMDTWVAEFLDENPECTVVHLGCGMDSRFFRIDPPATAHWFDIDYPEVVALRHRIYPDRQNYCLIGSSVTDLTWLDHISIQQTTLVVAEGLTMYLTREGGEELVKELVARFPRGEMIFDMFNGLGIKIQKLNPVVRKAKATLHWGIDDPRDLEKLGLQLVSVLDTSIYTPDVLARLSPTLRLKAKLAGKSTAFRRMWQIVRYRFPRDGASWPT